jgi:hypothetical protein
MAYVKTATLVTENSNTYATAAEWIAEHGKCGVYNTEYVTNGTMDVTEAGTGVVVVLTFPDESTSDAFTTAHADEIAAAAYTTTVDSTVTT